MDLEDENWLVRSGMGHSFTELRLAIKRFICRPLISNEGTSARDATTSIYPKLERMFTSVHAVCRFHRASCLLAEAPNIKAMGLQLCIFQV